MKKFTLFFLALLPLLLHARTNLRQGVAQNDLQFFIENKGQVRDQNGAPRTDIDFKLQGNGINLFIGDGRLHYQWSRNTNTTGRHQAAATYRLDMQLLGANAHAKIITEDTLDYYENYYLPQCPQGITAHAYKKLVYKNIYPNIDWVLYVDTKGKMQQATGAMEYDFIVHPGGNVADIKMQYTGAGSIAIQQGAVMITTPFGNITEQAPYSYELGTNATVPSAFIHEQENIVAFSAAAHKGTLVIDPIIAWGTYYGGTGADGSSCISSDALGNVFIAGYTSSFSNIATTGTQQVNIAGDYDGFIASFTGTGVPRWGTYYGGLQEDRFIAGDLDGAGNFYVCGYTQSTGLGTGSTQQPAYAGGRMDAMLAKFSNTGIRQWATYLGGSRFDSATSVACDGSGNVYIGGQTTSGNNISSPGSHQPGLVLPSNDSFNSFVVKYNGGNGTRTWGTYYPSLIIAGIATYGSNEVYATGISLTSSGIAYGNSFQSTAGDPFDGFIAKFDGAGVRQWGTYYGGSSPDYAYAIACDASGSVYIGGETRSTTGIATFGTHQTTLNGFSNAFMAKFGSGGNRIWGTYYGTGNGNGIYGIDFDGQGNIYITGATSGTGIATADGYQVTFGGGAFDAFMAEFKSSGLLQWGTYLGGPAHDEGNGIAFDNVNKLIYISGTTFTQKGFIPPGNYHDSSAGIDDAYIAAFMSDTVYLFVEKPLKDTIKCAGDSINIGFSSHDFNGNNVFTVELSDANGSFSSPVAIGSLTAVSAFGNTTIRCGIPASTPSGNGYRVRINGSKPAYTSLPSTTAIRVDRFPGPLNVTNNGPVCVGTAMHIQAAEYPGTTYKWTKDTLNRTTAIIDINIAQLKDTGVYKLVSVYGKCIAKDSTHVVIKPNPVLPGGLDYNDPLCENDTLKLYVKDATLHPNYTYSWTGPENFTSAEKEPAIPRVKTINNGLYTLIAKQDICTVQDTITVRIKPGPPAPVLSSNSPIYSGAGLQLQTSAIATQYSWTGPDSFKSTVQNPLLDRASIFASGTYTLRILVDGCPASDSIVVRVTAKDIDIFQFYPNPTQGTFTIKANVQADQVFPLQVVNMAGQVVYSLEVPTLKRTVLQTIVLPAYLANGVYMLRLRVDGQYKSIAFTLGK